MPDYSFSTLSSLEFEILSRDLLQSELGIRLETFTSGRDSGIDARWSNGSTETIIVQCKHYLGSGYKALLRSLPKEVKKISSQKYLRYILTTSVGLTPANKDEILERLHPYCQSTSDIFGRDDINNLLSRNPHIEEQNFKLWLTSEAVLSRMLNAGVLNDTESTLEKARKKVQRYVQNDSYWRAISVLEQSRFCIIAGLPGIGKTTLAEILLTYYVDRHNYQAFRVREDISEIKVVKRHNQKQIFYYDDFLGTTTLDSLRKNEDKRIIEFIEEVNDNENWKLILTTREYILRDAEFQYESLDQFPFEPSTCVISLDDYTTSVRAKILYNHLYFSDIPIDYKLSILRDNNYEKILSHRNYNPRIIEHMTSLMRLREVSKSTYVEIFLANLNNPLSIWKHAFERQISTASRHLLLVIVSMPEPVLLEYLKIAFWAFYRYRHKQYGFEISDSDFNDALKLLEGNFVKISLLDKKMIVEFHNPSVKDFLQAHLAGCENDVCDIIKSASYFEQYKILWIGHNRLNTYNRSKDLNTPFSGVMKNYLSFLDGIKRTLDGSSCMLSRWRSVYSKELHYSVNRPSFEERALFILNVTAEKTSSSSDQLIIFTINKLKDLLRKQDNIDKAELVKILSRLKPIGIHGEEERGELYLLARNTIVSQLNDVYDYEVLAGFFKAFRDDFSENEIKSIQSKFNQFCVEEVDTTIFNSSNGKEYLEDCASSLIAIAESLDVNKPRCINKIDEKILEMVEMDEFPKEDDGSIKGNNIEENDLTFLECRSMFNRMLLDIEFLDEADKTLD